MFLRSKLTMTMETKAGDNTRIKYDDENDNSDEIEATLQLII